MQAQDKWVGFAGIEVDGLHQAVLEALELVGDVEREGLGRNVGLGQAFVLCGGGEGCKEEEDRGVDEMTQGGATADLPGRSKLITAHYAIRRPVFAAKLPLPFVAPLVAVLPPVGLFMHACPRATCPMSSPARLRLPRT